MLDEAAKVVAWRLGESRCGDGSDRGGALTCLRRERLAVIHPTAIAPLPITERVPARLGGNSRAAQGEQERGRISFLAKTRDAGFFLRDAGLAGAELHACLAFECLRILQRKATKFRAAGTGTVKEERRRMRVAHLSALASSFARSSASFAADTLLLRPQRHR